MTVTPQLRSVAAETVQVLAGRRIVITRPRRQAGELFDKLVAAGAVPILLPTITIAPPDNPAQLDLAVRAAGRYDWIIFTSANGVEAFWARLEQSGKDASALSGVRLAAIGPATAQALADRGARPTFIPDEYRAEAIAEGIGEVRGQRILLPRADIAPPALAQALSRMGASVDEVAAYRTLPAAPEPQALAELEHGVDAITFTSSSTVRGFMSMVEGIVNQSVWREAAIVCIGPVTAETARQLGLAVAIVAAEYTTAGLLAALAEYFARDVQ